MDRIPHKDTALPVGSARAHQITHTAGRERRRIVVRSRPLRSVADMLGRDPGLVVCLVEADWDRVDEARTRAESMGLADRLTVHHAAALSVAALN
jgi:hypothetical protein